MSPLNSLQRKGNLFFVCAPLWIFQTLVTGVCFLYWMTQFTTRNLSSFSVHQFREDIRTENFYFWALPFFVQYQGSEEYWKSTKSFFINSSNSIHWGFIIQQERKVYFWEMHHIWHVNIVKSILFYFLSPHKKGHFLNIYSNTWEHDLRSKDIVIARSQKTKGYCKSEL